MWTPGPWVYDDTWGLVAGPEGEEVAAIHVGQIEGRRVDRSTANANATLIAAAPDMAEALEAALAVFMAEADEALGSPAQAARRVTAKRAIRSALAKARGETK